jgi:hypothetical protein
MTLLRRAQTKESTTEAAEDTEKKGYKTKNR